MYENEEWVPLQGYNHKNQYEVSNYGRVKRICKNGDKIFEPCPANNGYMRVNVGETRDYAHRVVAKHFIPNPDNLPEVNHIDGNKKNNYYKNLEWCSRKQNMIHASKNGLINRDSQKRKEVVRLNAQLAHEKIRRPVLMLDENGKIVSRFASIEDASKEIGVSDSVICTVLSQQPNNRYHKTAGGFQWVYEEKYDPSNDYSITKHQWEKAKKAVVMCDMEGNPIRKFSSQREANDYLGLYNKSTYISECCNGKRKTHGGYKWKWPE